MISVQDYLRQLKERGLAEGTLRGYSFVLKNFKHGVTRESIEAFQDSIVHYQPATKRCVLDRLSGYLKVASPQLAKYVVIPKVPKRLPQNIPSQRDVKVILQKPDVTTFDGLRDRAILELFYATGLRRKELLDLQVEDIDLAKQLVRVNQGKNSKDRILPLSKQALLWVTKYLQRVRPALNPKCNAVFLNPFGWKVGLTYPYVRVRRYSKNGCHKYRHAYATHLLQNGMKETSLQRLLGHSLISTTQLYTQVTIQDLQKSYRKFHGRDKWK